MAQRSMFFDAVSSDRQYDSASFAALLKALVQRDGVVYGYNNALAVSAGTGMTVSVGTGVAFVLGRMFEVYNTAETLTIAAADPTNPRIDRIVVRLDLSTGVRSVSLAVKTGVAQASPVAPALTRDVSVWELSLAQVYVGAGVTSIVAGNITDERANTTVCGYSGAVNKAGDTMTGPLTVQGQVTCQGVRLAAGTQETGLCGLQNNVAGVVTIGVGVNFKTTMSNIPSSITLTPIAGSNFDTLQVVRITESGFFMNFKATSAGSTIWYGTYTTVGN